MENTEVKVGWVTVESTEQQRIALYKDLKLMFSNPHFCRPCKFYGIHGKGTKPGLSRAEVSVGLLDTLDATNTKSAVVKNGRRELDETNPCVHEFNHMALGEHYDIVENTHAGGIVVAMLRLMHHHNIITDLSTMGLSTELSTYSVGVAYGVNHDLQHVT
jgi:hypothetical protein